MTKKKLCVFKFNFRFQNWKMLPSPFLFRFRRQKNNPPVKTNSFPVKRFFKKMIKPSYLTPCRVGVSIVLFFIFWQPLCVLLYWGDLGTIRGTRATWGSSLPLCGFYWGPFIFIFLALLPDQGLFIFLVELLYFSDFFENLRKNAIFF